MEESGQAERGETPSDVPKAPEVRQEPPGDGGVPLTLDVSFTDNYLLKNGTSDVLLCGNSSDAG